MQGLSLRIALISFLFVSGSMGVCAQESRNQGTTLKGQITGQVRLAESGEPAFNVLVSCDSFTGGVIGQIMTDRSGRFRFTNLTPSQYNITVRVNGYLEERQTVELLTNPSGYVQFQLKPDKAKSAPAKLGVIDASVPESARREYEAASTALASGKKEGIEEAVRRLEKALSTYPRFHQAALMLGTAYMDLGQWDKAERSLKLTVEINPQAANALFALGELFLKQKLNEQAEKTLFEGLKIEPRSYQGHLTLARVYWDNAAKIKDDTQARPLLEKAYEEVKKTLELNPNHAPAHIVKGNLLLRVRRLEDAQREFEEYLKIEPKGPFAEQAKNTAERIKKALQAERANQKP